MCRLCTHECGSSVAVCPWTRSLGAPPTSHLSRPRNCRSCSLRCTRTCSCNARKYQMPNAAGAPIAVRCRMVQRRACTAGAAGDFWIVAEPYTGHAFILNVSDRGLPPHPTRRLSAMVSGSRLLSATQFRTVAMIRSPYLRSAIVTSARGLSKAEYCPGTSARRHWSYRKFGRCVIRGPTSAAPPPAADYVSLQCFGSPPPRSCSTPLITQLPTSSIAAAY